MQTSSHIQGGAQRLLREDGRNRWGGFIPIPWQSVGPVSSDTGPLHSLAIPEIRVYLTIKYTFKRWRTHPCNTCILLECHSSVRASFRCPTLHQLMEHSPSFVVHGFICDVFR
ncbi:hypothetical protein BAD_1266 [Bifidobacterium adolescentis ATCC 15703]|uniref:Uncharacterized protein n=1 Tax=Bifidobacterium adolescentis (strain ATCC 15703 / DSM 20083 / NCTC 11814 / E194a) TaxID=367928 RepID=A1A2W4_BIFAA|nr:hypothetical protein BAD_1266 [Bifidobacterium adolescentis ATCC 15703]